MRKDEARKRALEVLNQVGIPAPEKRIHQYPHELSGGMRQRVMIAIAIACNPKLLIADEPTTALDVTIQAQIMELMQRLQQEMNLSYLFISHDINVVYHMCDRIMVMKEGKIIEIGETEEIYNHPREEYTKLLLCGSAGAGAGG